MAMKLKLSQKAIILVAVPLVLELAFIIALGELLQRAETAQNIQYLSKQSVADAQEVLECVYNQSLNSLSYTSSRRAFEADKFDALLRRCKNKIYALRIQNLHDEAQLQRVRKIDDCVTRVSCSLLAREQLSKIDKALSPQVELHQRTQLESASKDLISTVHDFTEAEKVANLENPEKESYFRQMVRTCLYAGIFLNLALAAAFTAYYNRSINSRLSVLMDNVHRLSKGRELNAPVGGDDEIAKLDEVFRKMTVALAVASARERTIFQYAADVIFSLNDRLQFTVVSQASQSMLGYAPDELVGRSIIGFVEKHLATETALKLHEVRGNGSASNEFEVRFKKADGAIVDALCSVRWSESENSFVCIAHDISAQKALEQAKEELMAMVSHDLRSPLASIQLFLGLVEKGVYGSLSDEGEARIKNQLSEVDRLVTLINSLLDIEKVEAGKLELLIDEVSLDTIIEKSVNAVAMLAERADVSIELERSDIWVQADGDRLVQVLVNLLSNAIKYSPAGSSVTLSVHELDDCLEVRVEDHGLGIPIEMQSRIFERFEQVTTRDARRAASSGLGLAIAKALVEQHGGSIGVNSEEGAGSTFWFRLYPSARPVTTQAVRHN